MYSGASLTSMMVTVASTSGTQITLGQHDVVLLPLFIPGDTVGSSAGLTTMPQQQLQCQIPSQTYANYALVLPRYISLSELSLPRISYVMCWCLLWCCFLFQVPMWLPCSPMGTQLLGFATPQPFGVHPWQAYLPPDDGL